MKNKKLSDEEFNLELERRRKEKELEDQREETRKIIEEEEPTKKKKRGKFITFLAQLLGLAPQIISVLKDTNVLKDKTKK